MHRYRVDFLLNGNIVRSCYRNGWTRADAYHFSFDSKEYEQTIALQKKNHGIFTWDATLVKESERSEP